jgi:hypothetical protein
MIRVGPCGASMASRWLDVVGPIGRMTWPVDVLPTFSVVAVGATASDDAGGVGVGGYQFYARSLSVRGGAWSPWSLIGTSTVDNTGGGSAWNSRQMPGNSYCIRVRALDAGGNLGPLSTDERCYSAAIDDRQMRRSRGWRAGRNDTYMRTYLATKRRGATLTFDGVRARRFSLLADAVPRGGRVEVRFGGRLLKRVWLRSRYFDSNDYRNISLGVLPSTRTGKLVIRVISRGKPVRIDGIHATVL